MSPGGDSCHVKIRAGAHNSIITSDWHKMEIGRQNKGVHHLLQALHFCPTSSLSSAGPVSHALNLMRELLWVKTVAPFSFSFSTLYKF